MSIFSTKADNVTIEQQEGVDVGDRRGMPPGIVAQDRKGRFVGTGKLTDKQAAFVRFHVTNGMNRTAAARAAGYADPNSMEQYLLRVPAVQQAIIAARNAEIADLAAVGLARLRDILGDKPAETVSGRDLQARIAFQMLDRAGHVAPKAGAEAPDPDRKPLAEMTVEELEGFIRRSRQALDQAAAPILDGEAVEVLSALPAPEAAPEDEADPALSS